MQRLQLGRMISSFEIKRMEKAANEIKKSVKGIKVNSYKSKLPFSRILGLPREPKKLKKKSDCNHIHITKGKHTIIELFGTKWKASGILYDGPLTKAEFKKVITILGKHQIYTFRSFKLLNPVTKYSMITMGLIMLFLSANLIFLSEELIGRAFGLLTALFAIIIMVLYVE